MRYFKASDAYVRGGGTSYLILDDEKRVATWVEASGACLRSGLSYDVFDSEFRKVPEFIKHFTEVTRSDLPPCLFPVPEIPPCGNGACHA